MTASKLHQSDLYRHALRVLCQWISHHYDFKLRREHSLERAETRGEAALPSPQPSQAWMGGAAGALVGVERTLLSAASDSCPEKREQSRSNRTDRNPKRRESFLPSGGASQPKSPALRFAIGRATRQRVRPGPTDQIRCGGCSRIAAPRTGCIFRPVVFVRSAIAAVVIPV